MVAMVQQLPRYGWWCIECGVGSEGYYLEAKVQAVADEHNRERGHQFPPSSTPETGSPNA